MPQKRPVRAEVRRGAFGVSSLATEQAVKHRQLRQEQDWYRKFKF
jgi:hypothetical protein